MSPPPPRREIQRAVDARGAGGKGARGRLWLPGLLACMLQLGGVSSHAQTAPEAAAEQSFDIPAGALGSAVSQLSAQLGILFSVDGRLTAGRTTAGLRGRYALRPAFERLLEGTGLELAVDGPRHTLRPVQPPAPAQARPESVLPTVIVRGTGEPDSYEPPSVRAATRTETPPRELPQSLTPISRELIDDLSIGSMAELIRYVPGMSAAQGEGNRDTPVFRGSSSTADFLFGGIRDDMQYYRDFYNVEQVEVMRGPNAMILGHGGTGGVINRVGKAPVWLDRGSLTLQAGSWNQKRAALDLNRVLDGDAAALRLNAMTENSASYRERFNLRRRGVNPVLGWRGDSGVKATIGIEGFEDVRTADRGIPSFMGRPLETSPSAFFGNPDLSVASISLGAFDAEVSADLGEGRSLRTHLRRAGYNKFFQNVFPGAVRQNGGVQEVAILAHNARTTRTNTFNQTDLTLPFRTGGIEHTLLAGFEIGRQQGDNRRELGFFSDGSTVRYVPAASPLLFAPMTFRTTATEPNSSGVARIGALYLQDQLRLSPEWSAIAGLRHDYLALDVQDRQSGQSLSSRDHLWSPRAGLMYRPAPDLSLYANYSVGYQPRAGEQYTSLTLSNQALQPEKFSNKEVGAKWSPRAGLETTAALYQLDRRNVAIADPASAAQQLMLVDGQRTRGLELSASGSLQPGWKVLAAYAWQQSRLNTALSAAMPAGASMPHVPRHSAAVWSRRDLDERWGIGMGVSYRGSVYASADNTVVLPSYVRWDMAVYFNPRPDVHLQLNVENLFDARYFAFAQSNNNITPGSPRALRLTVSFGF